MEKLSSYKKFTEMQKAASSIPAKDVAGTPVPNIPQKTSKVEKPQDTRYLKPKTKEQQEKGIDYKVPEEKEKEKLIDEKKVQLIGKVAKLPKGTLPSKGLTFLENIKTPKNSIWYIIVERQVDSELQMLKYNKNVGVNIERFVNDLKGYYTKKYSKNESLVKLIEAIEIKGADDYSWIKNIPLISLDGKKMVTIITEDLIKLLSNS